MNEFLKMDIFFVIASIAAIILAVLLIILLVYLIKFVKNLKYISDKVRTETDRFSLNIRQVLNFFGSLINRRKKGK